ncbi:MAG TPA: hypothetical protein P5207_10385, partial [Candidatus Sabulitectum sp.]|nr:hypothetical protein [Candidatus Sabulitectum sp.]
LSGEQREAIRWFWGSVPDSPGGSHESFKKLWSLLPGLYDGLTRSLRETGCGYDGMIYRDVAGRILRGEDLAVDAVRVYFVGFSALNACEKLLFSHLRDRGTASFFWDYDTWYTGDPDREAGYFLRNNLVDFPPVPLEIGFSALNRPGREVKVVQTSSRMEEARVLGTLLRQTGSGSDTDPNHTAVVLADESLLIPVMYSIPSGVEQINVTMGYPLRDAPVYPVMTALFRLMKNRRSDGYGSRFYTKDVLGVLSQQMVRDYDPAGSAELGLELSRSNLAFTRTNLLSSHPRLGFLFEVPAEVEGISDWLREVLYRFFADASAGDRNEDHRMSREFIYHVYEAVGKLKELLLLH